MERRLSAVLSADVVGYSRLMGANEVGTLSALNDRRTQILEPEIASCGGRVVKLTGDGLLAEFGSVVKAVECGCAIQSRMRESNAELPEDRSIQLRIGINLGDVIVQGDDIYGDGVNVAARIEGFARPGRVAVSQSVREQVGNRLDIRFEDRGEQQLKNIDRPLRLFEVAIDGGAEDSEERPAASLPDKPSIAVLPFNNMSGDPEQEYFSEGITEDIITDLSKVSGLFVVGRHTSFAYKGKSENLEKVATELGVRFLLEGSVRKAGNRIRITAQLIEGTTGGHLWADRYDRDLTDIFEIQDEITRAIVDQLRVRLVPGESSAISRAPTTNVDAYNLYLKGRQYFHNATKAFLPMARQMFVDAAAIDPGFARAYAGIAACDARMIGWYGAIIPEEQVLAYAEKALAIDPNLAEAHAARGDGLSFFDHPDEAIEAYEKALSLDPTNFDANFLYARFYTRTHQFEKAAPLYLRAMEVQPDDCQAPLMLYNILRELGRTEEAYRYGDLGVRRAVEAIRQHPDWSRPAQLAAATLAGMGRRDEAVEWLERAIALDPLDSMTLYNGACTWAQLGHAERAYELLERWLPIAGVEKRMWLRIDNDLEPLRGDERFKKILADAWAGIPAAAQP